MDLRTHLTTYINFNLWANTIMTNWLLSKDPALMTMEVKSSFPTVDKTLVHLWVAEHIWMKRMLGETYENILSVCEGKDTSFIVEKLIASSNGYVTYINEISDVVLDNHIKYRLLSGDEGSATIAHILQHIMNHSTYHRGQLVTIGRELGFTDPPKTDFMEYIRNITSTH
ncbi:MAG: hypothetical protein H7X99_01085 [Saprospiraceae bacterium]|nr:hypothetical protein [Saprospiraceae bacterium]